MKAAHTRSSANICLIRKYLFNQQIFLSNLRFGQVGGKLPGGSANRVKLQLWSEL